MSDVDHPAHYGGDSDYEVIKVLRAWDLDLAKGFCWGSLIKYTARAGKKADSAVQDRQKAEWYATELVSIEAELAGRKQTAEADARIRCKNCCQPPPDHALTNGLCFACAPAFRTGGGGGGGNVVYGAGVLGGAGGSTRV
jgi:hypothetical protein